MTDTDIDTLERLLAERRSCRAYLPQAVPDELITRLFTVAQRTASWCNTQPWQVLVTRGAATERFRKAYVEHLRASPPAPDLPFPREYRGVYLDRRRECGFDLYSSIGIDRNDRAARDRQALRNYELFGAPHVAIVTTDEALGTYGAVDCGGFVANLLLAAQALGLGAIAQAALASHSDFVRRHFGMDDSRRVLCGISFGYADESDPVNAFRTSRAAVDDVITWADQ